MACVCDTMRFPIAEKPSSMKLKQNKIQALIGKVPQTYLFAAALFAAFLPFDDTQLIFLVVGAIVYLLVFRMQTRVNKRLAGGKDSFASKTKFSMAGAAGGGGASNKQGKPQPRRLDVANNTANRPEGTRTITWQAIAPPSFSSTGFEAEVSELLTQIMPTKRCEQSVQDIAKLVHETLRGSHPEVQVLGFCTGDLNRGKAFGVAVPDVDIIINLEPAALVRTVDSRNPDRDNNLTKIYKATIRSCTEKLVSKGGFKFRRSAFRGSEPKVTLLTPNVVGELDHAVPMDFGINSTIPMYYAALLEECGRMDPRAKELIMFVKRWAKDRGVCHAAKGYLSPYLWCVMAVYFLQQRSYGDEPILPVLEEFPMASRLIGAKEVTKLPPGEIDDPTIGKAKTEKHVGTLFKEFVHFFHAVFNWKNEIVSISGAECNIDVQGGAEALRIADPFEGAGDLGASLGEARFARIREEFARAHELCCSEASLVELLQLWTPPETKESTENDKF